MEYYKRSSQDKERNFTVYQLVKIHNKFFEGKTTNAIEFGTDRGGTLTISKFIKKNSNIYAVDSFGFHAEEIKKCFNSWWALSWQIQTVYKKTRSKNFDHNELSKELNEILAKKNSKLELIVGYFPKLKSEDMQKITSLKFGFVYLDFDLYKPTIDCLNFIKEQLEERYNFSWWL